MSADCILFQTGVGTQNTDFTDFKITKQNLKIDIGQSYIGCSILCFENVHCLSYSYNNETHVCELWDEDFILTSDTSGSIENGWSYYYIVRDFDEDDMISSDDLKVVVDRLTGEQNLSKDEMQQLIDNILEEADLDDDDSLSFAEFEHVISKAPDFVNSFRIRL
ncbi:CIB1 [Mytilus coruscus]|uniref:CIB1 n=1 Tax=Mytilus coruscus TaxID=42192 RepID=A0A6J8CEZ1_MYTCO|nr:CIB1 [Mytilus coruscus]